MFYCSITDWQHAAGTAATADIFNYTLCMYLCVCMRAADYGQSVFPVNDNILISCWIYLWYTDLIYCCSSYSIYFPVTRPVVNCLCDGLWIINLDLRIIFNILWCFIYDGNSNNLWNIQNCMKTDWFSFRFIKNYHLYVED